MRPTSPTAPLLAAALISAIGCGGGDPTISGAVTYDGQPVETGSISFAPADGKGTPFGARISGGRYRIDKAHLGERVVSIQGFELPPIPPGSTEPVYTRETVPPNAVGNLASVEIVPGDQTLDFNLSPPN